MGLKTCGWCNGQGGVDNGSSWTRCHTCGGSGSINVPDTTCPVCGGRGQISEGPMYDGTGDNTPYWERCDNCGGSGKIPD